MFRQLAGQAGAANVFQYHPTELAHYLETVWAARSARFAQIRPSPPRLEPLLNAPTFPVLARRPEWHHLAYAYSIESTNISEIFDRVMYEYLNGERLGVFSPPSQMWLRNTEDLFYKDPPPFSVYAVKSDLRPDFAAVRRNAYYRMFGAELPHAMADGMDFVRPEASNREFADTLEEFLRETWVGIKNVRNAIGADSTDSQAVANLARRMSEMLRDRRQFGTLSREEFFSVAMMSWFHLTVEFNSPIIVDLRAQGTSLEQRLRRVGEKVNLAPHPKADSYFQLAEPMSRLLDTIETGVLNLPGNVPVLYNPAGSLRNDMETIITHWSITSGRMVKASKVKVT